MNIYTIPKFDLEEEEKENIKDAIYILAQLTEGIKKTGLCETSSTCMQNTIDILNMILNDIEIF